MIPTPPQPPPRPSAGPDMTDLVISEQMQRKLFGVEKYGMPLRANNGRSPLIDAYHESLDHSLYLRQAIEENRPSRAKLRAMLLLKYDAVRGASPQEALRDVIEPFLNLVYSDTEADEEWELRAEEATSRVRRP